MEAELGYAVYGPEIAGPLTESAVKEVWSIVEKSDVESTGSKRKKDYLIPPAQAGGGES